MSPAPHDAHKLELLLYGLPPINIGMILRVAETYRFRVSIYDQFRVLDDPERLRTITDFACGAVSRQGYQTLADETSLLWRGKRLVATSILPSGCRLPDFDFRSGDVFALGNEYDGLPEAILAQADMVLRIPMPAVWTPKPKADKPIDPARTAPVTHDGQPNLNVAMTAGIVCYAASVSGLGMEQPVAPPTRGVETQKENGR
jgi:tRNA(Leu) C34 or U34 (ribose-2'-O)-methylase TrmL